jgi:uncharacterized protein (TIGR01777 family)
MDQKVVIAGGTGFIGAYLEQQFKQAGYAVKIISRQQGHVSWDNQQALTAALEDASLLINLAGKAINTRFTEANKKALIESRIHTTTVLGNALLRCKRPPELWINASGAHIYGLSEDHAMTEQDPLSDHPFTALLAQQWEEAFFDFKLPATRQAALRLSIVLGKDGGVLMPYKWLARLGLGGTQASGRQMFSWVHLEDLYRIILFLQSHKELQGAFNVAAPEAVSNRQLMRSLRKTMHMPVGIPAPAFLIRIGGTIIGTEPDLLLGSMWVRPERLEQAGFHFAFPGLEAALQNLL